MSVTPNRRIPPAVQPDSFPVISFDEARATQAWEAYQAILITQATNPHLAENSAWTALRDDAFENFNLAFVVTQ